MISELDLGAVAALTDPVRRAAYQVVAASDVPVGRDEVAASLGVGRTLAAFHLDKLVDVGVLEVSFARRSGRSGPGAGRPAKLYRPAVTEHAVSVPPRAYRTGAEILAEALDRSGADATLYEVARRHGHRAGTDRAGSEPPPSDEDVLDLLSANEYRPEREDQVIRLRNCPFHVLAERFPPLICGMNLALVDGLLAGAGVTTWTAALDPAVGRCCVALTKNNKD
ncbi:transcriptional regulator [Solwaraspora sp. WMMD1047]|uniref:helix-turn-helix transcriptional regulator n=1 Tax=Solwaraspora sp. WMMD1047 TaxID=3016102 RepID=UPI0024171370|nr:transcriptional regulator [Solwaraspora sp. WMMD1047]MDG4832018.1 transcriptional regulator [Solwaraspora sp. WMMD1047]